LLDCWHFLNLYFALDRQCYILRGRAKIWRAPLNFCTITLIGERVAAPHTKGSAGMQKLRQWLVDTYNGLYVIVIKPYMPNTATVVALAIGVIFGLIWAYAVSPTQYYDAAPYRLSENWREEWVKLVAAARSAGFYEDTEIQRLLSQVESPGAEVNELIQETSGTVQQGLSGIQDIAQNTSGTPAVRPGGIVGDILNFIIPPIVLIVLAVIAILLWGVFIKPNFVDVVRERMRPKTDEDRQRAANIEMMKQQRLAEVKAREEVAASAAGNPYGAPITLKLPSYMKGRSFDESYAIENANDEFLGEFGATIAKTIGDTNEICAVEIWLFDKEDFVRTLTKLFVTEHAYNDPAIRSDLENRVDDPENDFVIAKPGAVIRLETDALLIQATVTNLELGSDGLLPPNSYMKNFSFKMEAWEKKGAGASAGAPAMATPAAMPTATPTSTYTPPATPAPSAPFNPPPPSFTPPSTPPAYTPPPPPLPPQPKRATTQDDDPFGGTGDFTPIGS
jgi:hypothetical protein